MRMGKRDLQAPVSSCISLGRWYHLAFQYDGSVGEGGTTRIFMQGKEVSSQKGLAGPSGNQHPVLLGNTQSESK